MNKIFSCVSMLLLTLVIVCGSAFAQSLPSGKGEHKQAITIGLLQGGGSLVGIDYEILISNNIGLQIGAGFIGFGASVNYHFKPQVNSSAISFGIWNQGLLGERLGQRILGITYLYRQQRGGLTAQIGLGTVIKVGELMEDFYGGNPPLVILLYSIGWYLKF